MGNGNLNTHENVCEVHNYIQQNPNQIKDGLLNGNLLLMESSKEAWLL